ncbi:HAD family hydrolase [Parapedobacter sp. ISTM3]|uniref:D-glycero-alpha-D-manno-heptose-1,7-bisphosphate 7-phosphatase n=1 Tax=Parapedobacter sp. ISTM3 TaxID=2800130 RepID=UPI0019068D87|nr:HAD family hydrolase [Parapedobacter sp. ISTM3]MBK1441564.1 HAD family hydrolase [Parapedobacter sp. ISTM3]
MPSKKAIFLDKDGTLIRDVPYNADPAKIELLAGVADGLRQLGTLGYSFFVVTNQAGVAKGYFREEALLGVEKKLQQLLSSSGVVLSGFYYCPHHPEGTVKSYTRICRCRKPMPGMLLQAAATYGISLGDSWMVGDILDDVEAGNRAGCKTVLIDGLRRERKNVLNEHQRPSYIADSFTQAANLIIKSTSHGKV